MGWWLGLAGWWCTTTLEFWVRFPNERNQGKQGATLCESTGFKSSGHVQQNGLLSHPQDLDAPLRLAAQCKVNSYRQK